MCALSTCRQNPTQLAHLHNLGHELLVKAVLAGRCREIALKDLVTAGRTTLIVGNRLEIRTCGMTVMRGEDNVC